MLEDIKTLIEKDEYKKADSQLKNIINDADKNTELYSNATYLRGCINIEYKFKEKSNFIAKESFLECINSKHSMPLAFCRYADLEEDNHVAINYLKKGLEKFPKDGTIYRYLLDKTKFVKDRLDIIKQIEELNIIDYYLFVKIISIYINQDNNWQDCYVYSKTITSAYKLDNEEKLLFNLISALSLIANASEVVLEEAENLLLELIDNDINNELNYAPYMGLILLHIQTNKIDKVKEYFDKIPFSGLKDYDSNPWLIYINFESFYNKIFNKLQALFLKDKIRKQKVNILYSMYICQREYYWEGVDKIQKKHTSILKKAFKDYPQELKIGQFLFFAQCKLKLYFEAYETVIAMYHSKTTSLEHICFDRILNEIEETELLRITQNLCNDIKTFYISNLFMEEVIDKIISHLYDSNFNNKYRIIYNIAENLDSDNIKESNCKFEIAYSYEELDNHKKAEKIYKLELKSQPNSSAVLNNLGVIYKNNKEYEKAIQYFTKGLKADPNNEKCPMNLEETKKKLQEQKNKKYKNLVNNLTIEFFENIGYNEDLKILLDKISNIELKEVLNKDIEECAICIATNQNKSAIILCGSIVEAILMDCILNRSIKKYKIKDKNKNIKDMSLNELLTVAKQEGMISDTTYNLSHFIKDYRNIIHPSNLLRKSFKISNERVMVIWNILKEIMESLLN
ncbi:MAG: tetratricopeptide repeat protein [Brachyspira sp.]|nr:tetratricopeptide repeat protein [Brachyspira sp.]